MFRISYGKYNTPESVMNLEFFQWYSIDLFANFTGKIILSFYMNLYMRIIFLNI